MLTTVFQSTVMFFDLGRVLKKRKKRKKILGMAGLGGAFFLLLG